MVLVEFLLKWLTSLMVVVLYPILLVLLLLVWLLPGAIVAPIVWHGGFYKKDKIWLAFCPYFITWLRSQIKHK